VIGTRASLGICTRECTESLNERGYIPRIRLGMALDWPGIFEWISRGSGGGGRDVVSGRMGVGMGMGCLGWGRGRRGWGIGRGGGVLVMGRVVWGSGGAGCVGVGWARAGAIGGGCGTGRVRGGGAVGRI